MSYNRFWSSVEREVFNNDPWIEINDRIITSNDLKVFIASLKGNNEYLSEMEKREANNIRNWYSERKKTNWYEIRNPNLRKILDNDNAIKSLNQSWKLDKNQALLNELIETALLDLLQFHFRDKWIRVIKTSKYDDIKSWIDYILEIWTEDWIEYIWIDLTLSSNHEIIEWKNNRKKTNPLEFSIIRTWKSQESMVEIPSNIRLNMDRKVLVLEPNFVQIFLYEYMDMVRVKEDVNQINDSTVEIAIEETISRYKKEKFEYRWIYQTKSKNQIITWIKNDLVSNLVWNEF